MSDRIDFKTSKAAWIAVGLMALQIVVKLTLELAKAGEAGEPGILAVAIIFTFGWAIIIPLCVAGKRIGYWAGAAWGLLHYFLTPAVPILGLCDHEVFAAIVAAHGVVIAGANIAVLIISEKNRKGIPYLPKGPKEAFYLILSFASTTLRAFWLAFFEPRGAIMTKSAWAEENGVIGAAGSSLIVVVVTAMIALCLIIPGLALKKRWAFRAEAIFGAAMVVLTASILAMRAIAPMPSVQQGFSHFGPYIVITASLGMLVSGIGTLRARRAARALPIQGQPEM